MILSLYTLWKGGRWMYLATHSKTCHWSAAHPRPIRPDAESPECPLNRRLDGVHRQSTFFGELLNPLPLPGSEPRIVQPQPQKSQQKRYNAYGRWPSVKCVVTARVNRFGGLELACWPLVPKFAGSNPAEDVVFFRAKKSSTRLPSEGN